MKFKDDNLHIDWMDVDALCLDMANDARQLGISKVDIHKIIEDNKIGEKIRDGFRVSITGEVNAGKSSLLNLIAKRDVAIVSDEAGTTRDVIETYYLSKPFF